MRKIYVGLIWADNFIKKVINICKDKPSSCICTAPLSLTTAVLPPEVEGLEPLYLCLEITLCKRQSFVEAVACYSLCLLLTGRCRPLFRWDRVEFVIFCDSEILEIRVRVCPLAINFI